MVFTFFLLVVNWDLLLLGEDEALCSTCVWDLLDCNNITQNEVQQQQHCSG